MVFKHLLQRWRRGLRVTQWGLFLASPKASPGLLVVYRTMVAGTPRDIGNRSRPYNSNHNYKPWCLPVRRFWCVSINSEKTGFPCGSEVENPPVMQEPQETWVQSLGQDEPLEEGTATHSSILARRIPCTEEPGRLQSMGSQESQTWLKQLSTHTHTHTMTLLLVMSSLSVNQQRMLDEMSLNRSRQKTKVLTDPLTKMLWPDTLLGT